LIKKKRGVGVRAQMRKEMGEARSRQHLGIARDSYRLIEVDLEVLVYDVFIRAKLGPYTVEAHILLEGSMNRCFSIPDVSQKFKAWMSLQIVC
jgi:hypothetical protein